MELDRQAPPSGGQAAPARRRGTSSISPGVQNLDTGEVLFLSAINADDVRFEPLVPGVSYSVNPETQMFTGCARTAAWNTPDSGITLPGALEHTGLNPEFWNITHVTAYMWDDPAQGGSVIAYELQLAEIDPGSIPIEAPGEGLVDNAAEPIQLGLDEKIAEALRRGRRGLAAEGGEA